MESNWRWLVWETGLCWPAQMPALVGYRATLVARLATPKLVNGFLCTHIVQFRFHNLTQCTYAWTSLSGCIIGMTGDVPQVGGFPYGEAVDPD